MVHTEGQLDLSFPVAVNNDSAYAWIDGHIKAEATRFYIKF